MLYAFIDESEREDKFYFLGALLLTQDQRKQLSQESDAIMHQAAQSFNSLSPREELHGSAIMGGREEPWRSLQFRQKIWIFEKTFRAIQESGAVGYSEGIDVSKHRERPYKNHYPPRELAFSYLLEKLNTKGASGRRIQVLADQHHTAKQSNSNFKNYQEYGTLGYKSSKLQNIYPDIHFIDSAGCRELQAIDMATYWFNRLRTLAERDDRTKLIKAETWQLVEPAFRSPRGGTRIWP